LSTRLQNPGDLGSALDGTLVPGVVPALHWVFAAQAALALAAALVGAFVIGWRRMEQPTTMHAEPRMLAKVAASERERIGAMTRGS
jgi:Na+(H+)/acetate symporter ActP